MAEHRVVDDIGRARGMPRRATIALAAAGAAVALLGLVVIVGWHTETAALVQFHPVSNAMRYNAAVAFLLSGLALLALTRDRRGVGALLGAGAAAIGLLRFVEYALGVDIELDHLLFDSRGMAPPFAGHGMSPITAVCFVLTGTATVFLGIWPGTKPQPIVVGFLGSMAAAMGAAATAGYCIGIPTYVWGDAPGIAVHTAAGFVVLGAALVAVSLYTGHASTRRDRWVPPVAATGLLLITFILWQAFLAQDHARVVDATRSKAEGLATHVAVEFSGSVQALERMARRHALRPDMPEEEWRADARLHAQHMPQLQAIEWVDPSYRARWVEPDAGNEAAVGLDLALEERRRAALDAARSSRAPALSRSVDLVQGGTGFLADVPIFHGESFEGFVAGVFRSDGLFDSLLRNEIGSDFTVTVFDGEREIYASGGASVGSSYRHEVTMDVYGVPLRLRVEPTPAFLARTASRLPEIALGVGFGFAALLAAAAQLALTAHRRARQVESANRALTLEIRERVQAEEARRESERRFRTLGLNAPVGIFETDVDGRCVFVNTRWAEMTQLAPGAWLGDGWMEALHPDDRERVVAEWTAATREGREFALEYRFVRGDGEVLWVRGSASALRDEGGRIVGFIGTTTDITSLKTAEEEVRTSEERLALAMDASELGLWDWNVQTGDVLFSPRLVEMLGYEVGELEANVRSWEGLVHPDDWPSVSSTLEAYFRGETAVYETDHRLRAKSGEWIWIHDRGKVVSWDGDGKPLRMIGTHTDVSARRRAAEVLTEAKNAAEAATRAKSEFLAIMSHEIRTPMNAVIGMSSLLLDTHLTSEQKEFAETIRGSSEALLGIINDILDFSKIESGHLELEETAFDLRDCIEEALDLVSAAANEKGLDLAYTIDDQTPGAVTGDPTRTRQVLANLLSNAVKFTSAGEVLVSLGSRRIGKGAVELTFAVRDTGIGIPADRMDRLFQSFSQVDASTTRQFGGTGLGLAISKRLCEMMGGTMWVESTPGAGSTFSFTIRAQAAPGQTHVFLRAHEPSLAGRRLLIVDDNATNRRILERQAERWGMRARATASGSEALEWVRTGEPFDVAILDMQMPEMDGLMLADRMREYRPANSLPLVLLTSIGQRVTPAREQDACFAAALNKPVKPAQLHEALVDILGGAAGNGRPRTHASRFDGRLAERHPLRILLAEDSVVNQQVALRMLARMGYRADLAGNGLEVLEALERQPYDLVLMDVQMPDLDGIEAARRICERWPRDERPRIVAMTANAMMGDRERCLAVGMDDYITKPVRPEDLQAALESSSPRSGPRYAPAPLAPDPIDRSALAELELLQEEGEPDVVVELLDAYLRDAPLRVAALDTAVAGADARALELVAHSLKASSATFGAYRLADSCLELEGLGREGRFEGAKTALARLRREFDLARASLEAERARRGGSADRAG